MKLTPLQEMKKDFGDRKGLVDRLVDLVEKQRGDSSNDEVRSRLMSLSNKKLLRLYGVEQKVRERFGDREKLVAHILKARKDAALTADESYETKLRTYSTARLLDMTRQRHPAPPVKLTPEQKLAAKRGRKARERAAAKMKSL
ncbi:MAG: hypothetical protein H6729_05920 [Deltaproteobacteria bacterium]|nr:hypothetical protein [Deltaproteobacteria bacterium]